MDKEEFEGRRKQLSSSDRKRYDAFCMAIGKQAVMSGCMSGETVVMVRSMLTDNTEWPLLKDKQNAS